MHTISKKDLNSAELEICAQEGVIRRLHLLVGGVHSVTTNSRGKKNGSRSCGKLKTNEETRKLDGMESSVEEWRSVHAWMIWNTRTTWALSHAVWCAMSDDDDARLNKINKKTTCTFTCQVSRFMFHCVGLGCHVVIGVGCLVVRFQHAYVIPSFHHVVVRLYLVIVNWHCSHNYCLLHIAEMGHLRCRIYKTVKTSRSPSTVFLTANGEVQTHEEATVFVKEMDFSWHMWTSYTDDSAENKKYISAVLDTFSIPNFYIRKGRPHGHRYGKAPGCKEYHTANQLQKRCRKKKYDSIHDRYIRDETFRKAMIEVGRSEKIIKEMDQLASENHTYQATRAEIDVHRGNWWIHSNVANFDSVPTRHQLDFKKALPTMYRLKQAEDEKQYAKWSQSSSSSSCKWQTNWWEVRLWEFTTKMEWPLIERCNLCIQWPTIHFRYESQQELNSKFLSWIYRLQLTAVYCHRREV